MATINRKLADELVAGGGKIKQGTAGYVLVRYQNRTKYDVPKVDFFNPDAKLNVFDYAIFRNKRGYEQFLNSDTVGGIDVLWASEQFKRDELTREQAEIAKELQEAVADFIEPEYVDIDDDGEPTRPSRRER